MLVLGAMRPFTHGHPSESVFLLLIGWANAFIRFASTTLHGIWFMALISTKNDSPLVARSKNDIWKF